MAKRQISMVLEPATIDVLDERAAREGFRYRAQLADAILSKYAAAASLPGAPSNIVDSMRFDVDGAESGGELTRRLMLEFLDQLVGHHMAHFWGPNLAAQLEFRSRLGGMIAHRDPAKEWFEDPAERTFRKAIQCMFHPYGIGCKSSQDAGITTGRAAAAYNASLFRAAWASWFFYQGLVAKENPALSSHLRAGSDVASPGDPLMARIRATPYHKPERLSWDHLDWSLHDWLRHQFQNPSDPASS